MHDEHSTLGIILNQRVRDMLDHFTGCFGIRIGYFSPSGDELQAGAGLPLCRYCRLGREYAFGSRCCLELDRRRREQAAAEKCLVHYQCHAGLTEAIAPVVLQELLVGFVMIGQFRTTAEPPPEVIASAARKGLAPAELTAAFAEVPCVAPERVPHILGLFACLVHQISHERLVALKGDLAVEKVLQHFYRHPQRNVSLAEAARIAGRSTSTVSHLFQAKLGRSFKQSQIASRMKLAAELLESTPRLTINEIAQRLGYRDPFYFTRVFRKHYGVPPSAFGCRGKA